MKINHLLSIATIAVFVSSCANQKQDDLDTLGYEFDDYGTPDGAPYQEVNPVYDTPAAFEESSPAPAPATARPATPAPSRSQATHTVVRGDTLWGLSRKYGVSVDAIKQANNMSRDTVVLGTRLVIPTR